MSAIGSAYTYLRFLGLLRMLLMRAKMSVKDIVMPCEPIGELGIRGEMCRVSPQSVPFVIGPPPPFHLPHYLPQISIDGWPRATLSTSILCVWNSQVSGLWSWIDVLSTQVSSEWNTKKLSLCMKSRRPHSLSPKTENRQLYESQRGRSHRRTCAVVPGTMPCG